MHTFTAVGNFSEEKVNKYKELVILQRGHIYNIQTRLNQRFQKGLVRTDSQTHATGQFRKSLLHNKPCTYKEACTFKYPSEIFYLDVCLFWGGSLLSKREETVY